MALYTSKMIRFRSTDLQQQPSQFVQTVMRKVRRIFRLFFKLLESCNPLLHKRATGSPGSKYVQDRDKSTDRQDMAPTYIINIHNSTLTNCIFGSNNGQRVNAERQYLPFHNPENMRHEAERCSCSFGQQGPAQSSSAPQGVQIHSSAYVVIGDYNKLTVVTEGPKAEEAEERKEEEQASSDRSNDGDSEPQEMACPCCTVFIEK